MEQHYEGKLHKCHCGLVFKTEWELHRHELIHDDNKVTCEVCNRIFAHAHSFKKHWARMHLKTLESAASRKVVNLSGPYICDKCGKIILKRTTLRQHLLVTHLNEPRFFCDLCPKSFKVKSLLENHMGQHFKINPLTCNFCDQTNASKWAFKIHMLRHGPKTECEVCHKMVANIYYHMKNHGRAKCQICGKSVRKNYLQEHIKTIHKSKKLKLSNSQENSTDLISS